MYSSHRFGTIQAAVGLTFCPTLSMKRSCCGGAFGGSGCLASRRGAARGGLGRAAGAASASSYSSYSSNRLPWRVEVSWKSLEAPPNPPPPSDPADDSVREDADGMVGMLRDDDRCAAAARGFSDDTPPLASSKKSRSRTRKSLMTYPSC